MKASLNKIIFEFSTKLYFFVAKQNQQSGCNYN